MPDLGDRSADYKSADSFNKTMPNSLWKKHGQDGRRSRTRPKLPPLKFTNSVVDSEDPLTVSQHRCSNSPIESSMRNPESKR
jgi:hypothetical protein